MALTGAGPRSAAPGLQALPFAVLFPVSLLLTLLTGAELFTGSACVSPPILPEVHCFSESPPSCLLSHHPHYPHYPQYPHATSVT